MLPAFIMTIPKIMALIVSDDKEQFYKVWYSTKFNLQKASGDIKTKS